MAITQTTTIEEVTVRADGSVRILQVTRTLNGAADVAPPAAALLRFSKGDAAAQVALGTDWWPMVSAKWSAM